MTALKDTRDNQVYAVAKLADEKCWMTENLRLDAANSTDVTKSQGFGGVFEGLANSETTTFTTSAIANSLYTNDISTSSLIRVLGDNAIYRMPRYNNQNTANAVSTMSSRSENVYSYGNYYNWPAATANTSNITTIAASRNTGTSICPAGWRLPTGAETDDEYNELVRAWGGGTIPTDASFLKAYPYNFVLSGEYYDSASFGRGSDGHYWSSNSRSEADRAYFMTVYLSGAVSTRTFSTKAKGLSVRCIRDGSIEITLDANDGTDRVARIYGASGDSVTLPTTTSFSNENYVISSWNTNAAGTGTSYTSSYTISSATTLYAQWTPVYTITYNGNGAESSHNMNSISHLNIAENQNIQLRTPNYHKTGYGFLGWSTTQINPDASNASTLIANAKIYGPNETVTASSTTLGQSAPASIVLYAVWLKSSGIMQDWDGCQSMTQATYSNNTVTPGSVIALTDYRDNETYAVARIEDGSCWMIENVRINPSIANITSSNTNSPTSSFLSEMREQNDWCSEATEECANKVLTYSLGTVGAGKLYNWYTATAGNGKLDTDGNPSGDLCPAGWHLPTGQGGEISSLVATIGGNTTSEYFTGATATTIKRNLTTYPNNFIYAGYYTSSLMGSTTAMEVWTSEGFTNSDTHWAFRLATTSDSTSWVYTGYGRVKQNGASMRCIKNDVTITYDGNDADSGITMTGYRSNAKRGATTVLTAPNYKRAGYGFLGWSTTQINPDASNFSTLLSNATVYGPNQTITIPANSSSNIVFYAVWIKSAGNMQSWSGCSSLSTNGVTALKDTRDNQVYAVAKLADGNCWMIENLRLDAASSGNANLSQGFGGAFIGLASSETTTFATSTLANSLYTIDRTATGMNYIAGGLVEYRIPRYNNQNTANSISQMTNIGENVYSYGNYYNYPAATASTIDVSATNSPNLYGTSICPLGWRLPKEASSEYTNLGTAAKTGTEQLYETYTKYPLNFVLSGYFHESASYVKGYEGEYWQAGNTYGNNATILTVGMNGVNAKYTSAIPSQGMSVRCLLASGLELKLDSNDSTGKVARIYANAGNNVTLSSDIFFDKSRTITSWNTAANGTGTSYITSYPFASGATSGVTLYAQWENTYTIIYDGNNATGSTTMAVQNLGVKSGNEVTLYASNYSRSGYGFAGWSTTQIDPDSTNASTQIANATIYGPNETITVDSAFLNQAQSGTRDIKLYAVWVKSAGNMQDWQGCSSMTTNQVTARRDTRDGNVYAIAKLADGQCWMIENLRLNNNASNPNWGDPTTSQGFGGVFNGLAASERTSFNSTAANTLYTMVNSSTRYVISGNNHMAGDNFNYRFPRYNNEATTAPVQSMMSSDAQIYSYGNYYTWAAAMGNTQQYRRSDGATGSNNAGTSICPAGWQLPNDDSSTTDSDYNKLRTALTNIYGTTDPTTAPFRKFPNNYIYNGQSAGANVYGRGVRGYYWTSSMNTAGVRDNTITGKLFTFSNANSTSIANGYYSGVRCRASTGITVTLDSNDGSGRVARIYGTAGSAVTLPYKNFARSNSDLEMYGFTTSSAGTGTVYTTSYTIPSGSTGVTLYAQWKQSYTINYDGNGDSGAYSMSVSHIKIIEGDEVFLYPSNYSRPGYGFAGWSFTQIDPDASNASSQIASATIYGPMETITAPARTTATRTLYAVWVKSAGSMQSWTGCSSMVAGNITARTDTRDNNTYAIAKLADGKCWMIENLRLNHTASITTSNTQGFGGVFHGLAASESSNFSNSTVANTLYGVEGSGSTYIIDTSSHTYNTYDNRSYSIPRYNNSNTTNTVTTMTSTNQNIYSYGNYYNHPAAIADTTMYTSLAASEASTASICPKGWKLPTGGASGKDFESLTSLAKIDSNDTDLVGLRRYPNNFIFSGRYDGSGPSTLLKRGLSGVYFAKTTTATDNFRQAGALIIYYESYTNTMRITKFQGASVRCIAGS